MTLKDFEEAELRIQENRKLLKDENSYRYYESKEEKIIQRFILGENPKEYPTKEELSLIERFRRHSIFTPVQSPITPVKGERGDDEPAEASPRRLVLPILKQKPVKKKSGETQPTSSPRKMEFPILNDQKSIEVQSGEERLVSPSSPKRSWVSSFRKSMSFRYHKGQIQRRQSASETDKLQTDKNVHKRSSLPVWYKSSRSPSKFFGSGSNLAQKNEPKQERNKLEKQTSTSSLRKISREQEINRRMPSFITSKKERHQSEVGKGQMQALRWQLAIDEDDHTGTSTEIQESQKRKTDVMANLQQMTDNLFDLNRLEELRNKSKLFKKTDENASNTSSSSSLSSPCSSLKGDRVLDAKDVAKNLISSFHMEEKIKDKIVSQWYVLPTARFPQNRWLKIHECIVGVAFLKEAKSGSAEILKKIIPMIRMVHERVITVAGTVTVLLDCCYLFWNFAMDSKMRYAMNEKSVNEFFESTAAFRLLIKDEEISKWNAKILRGFVCIAEALLYAKQFKVESARKKVGEAEIKFDEDIPQTLSSFILYVNGLLDYQSELTTWEKCLQQANKRSFPDKFHLAFHKMSKEAVQKPWKIRYLCDIVYGFTKACSENKDLPGMVGDVFDILKDLVKKFGQYPEKVLLELAQLFVAIVYDKEDHSHYCEKLYETLVSDFELTETISNGGFPTDWAVTILDLFLAIHPHLWTAWKFKRAHKKLALCVRDNIAYCYRNTLVSLKAEAFISNFFVGLQYDLLIDDYVKMKIKPCFKNLTEITSLSFEINPETSVYFAFIWMFSADRTASTKKQKYGHRAYREVEKIEQHKNYLWASSVLRSSLYALELETDALAVDNFNQHWTKLINAFRTERFRGTHASRTLTKWRKILKQVANVD